MHGVPTPTGSTSCLGTQTLSVQLRRYSTTSPREDSMRADHPYPLCSAFFRVQSNLNPTSHNPSLQKPPPFTHFPQPKFKVPRSLNRPISPCFDLSHQALNPVSPIATPALQPTLTPKFSTPQPHHYHLIYLYQSHRTTSRHGDFI